MTVDSLEILLTATLVISSILLTIVGVQLIIVLRTISKITSRIEFVSKEAEKLTVGISRSMNSMLGAFQSIGLVGGLIRQFMQKRSTEDHE